MLGHNEKGITILRLQDFQHNNCFIILSPVDDKHPYGLVTLKHIYEIAKIKKQDTNLQDVDLKEICKQIIASSRTVGIKVVKDISVEDLRTFREEAGERRRIEEEAMAQARQEALDALKA